MSVGLWPTQDIDTLVPADVFLSRILPSRRRTDVELAPREWNEWLRAVLPKYFGKPLGRRHKEFWKWVLSVQAGVRPEAFIGIWPRGAGKSTSAEGGAVALGVRGRRKYGLYISGTQDQADKHVATIASMLESPGVERFYPDHGRPKLGKHGNQRAWRRNRVWTAGDFAIDALGLDVAARGLKLDEQRPDFIVLDDIDGKHDSIATTVKKTETITTTILPAGADDLAILAIQNLISRSGFFTSLVDGSLDALADRKISGPFPAIEGFKYEYRRHPKSGIRYAHITAGKATWEGQQLEKCQKDIMDFGLAAFEKECQHDVMRKGSGTVLRFTPANLVDLSDDECKQLMLLRTAFGGIDFQAARFAFVLFVIDRHGRAIRVDEYFSQFEGLRQRAYTIHHLCEFYGITKMMPIWGDAANPQDIIEINSHFTNGWGECSVCTALWDNVDAPRCPSCKDANGRRLHVKSKLRVVAVAQENKLRRPAVEKINDALDRQILLYRTGVEYDWKHAWTSDDDGTEMRGSRLLWELDAWRYPKTKPGEAQDENPDDHTADGGDMMAAQRYALMSHWRHAKFPVDHGVYEHDRAEPIDYKRGQFREVPHAVDTLIAAQRSRRSTPRVKMPRPRTGR
jgi:hypothetical protein